MNNDLINMPRTKRGLATLNNILSAAAQVFYEKGYHSASINEITRVAGVASEPSTLILKAIMICISFCCFNAVIQFEKI